jgi:hypothetical protein
MSSYRFVSAFIFKNESANRTIRASLRSLNADIRTKTSTGYKSSIDVARKRILNDFIANPRVLHEICEEIDESPDHPFTRTVLDHMFQDYDDLDLDGGMDNDDLINYIVLHIFKLSKI